MHTALRSSCHPFHTKRAFPFSPALRIRRICSSNETYNLGLLNQEIHTHTSDSPTRIPLVVGYHPAIAQYHLFFTSTSTFSHPPNFVLLCLNKYLSLPSYILTRRKFAKGTSRLEPELSIKVLWCYTLFKVLYFSTRSSRTSVTGGHFDWV